MKTKQYNSFEQIDNDLNILRLKREINKETIKNSLQRVKTDLYPSNLFVNFKGIVHNYILTFTIKNLRKLVRLG